MPGLGITFKCAKGNVGGTVLLGGIAHATVLFSECSVEGNLFCKVYETKAAMETEKEADRGFIAASGLGEIVLMGGEHFLLVSSGATPFSTIYLTKSTKGCTMPLENTVSGSTVLAIPYALTPIVFESFRTISQTTLEKLFFSDILMYGNQTAWPDNGIASAALLGPKVGEQWGGRIGLFVGRVSSSS